MSEHCHPHTETKNVIHRISRAAGHLEAIKKMVEDGRDCGDVLIQLAAVRSAINNIGKIVLADHGYEAARQIRNLEDRAKAGIPIVAVTANAFEDKQIALQAGMNGHLAKPYDIPAIIETLKGLLK